MMTTQYNTVEQFLGGPEVLGKKIESEMDLFELSKEGIPKQALIALAGFIKISMSALVTTYFHTTIRTLQRKKNFEKLSSTISEQAIQIAEVYSRGQQVFESIESFKLWLVSSSLALGNQKPVDLLSSRYGAQMVLEEIGRIEFGIFS